ncbi:serine/threonine protein kinase [Caldimonas brevitalea]|uniref:Serine/threonine protein kinase n=1 Tax=Caldimonas brevitalea TaxID=413882 RepID=A0A0G3BUY5_9BURK|nr:serine/threonine-protein kinase [Caldimonas brevitalea]AKJ30315.1 serine/threonine protein kinase [Caldimonas brevitalea]
MPASPLPPAHGPAQAAAPTLSHQDALPSGTRLGEFQILRVLGMGGFAIVYLAFDVILERQVAIKEYLPASLAARSSNKRVVLRTRSRSHAQTFATGLRSFVNEAKLLARFDHPSLVKVYRFWEANNTAYMVMPYYKGVTLQAACREMIGPPTEAWLRALLMPLLGALEEMHAHSCYHRDIAPDNILLLENGQPVLLDFGAARRVIADRTQNLTAILKPSFAPIEQYADASHLKQGPWTDLYALAAVVHYCLSHEAPMPSVARALQDQLKPAREVARHLSSAYPHRRYGDTLLKTIDWAMAVRPQDRPQSVAEFRAALDGRVAAAAPARAPRAPARIKPQTPTNDAFGPTVPQAPRPRRPKRPVTRPPGRIATRPPLRPRRSPRLTAAVAFGAAALLLIGAWWWGGERDDSAHTGSSRAPAVQPAGSEPPPVDPGLVGPHEAAAALSRTAHRPASEDAACSARGPQEQRVGAARDGSGAGSITSTAPCRQPAGSWRRSPRGAL